MPQHDVLFGVLAAVLGAQASAQAAAPPQTAGADERAVERAVDAFGIRIGIEQIGLYTESQVRGFNLQDAGNYRMNGAYYAKSSNLVDTVVAGVVTRVGYNALNADFPAPSGVVDYRLRSPFEAPRLFGEAALREYGGQFYQLSGAAKNATGDLAGLVGAQVNLGKTTAGQNTRSNRLGGIAEWRGRKAELTAFGTINQFDLEGSYGFAASGGALPPRLVFPRRYVPNWGDHDGFDYNAGLAGTWRPTSEVTGSLSLVYSRLDLDRADYALMRVDERGLGSAVATHNQPRVTESVSGAARVEWRHAPGRRLYGEARARRTSIAYAPAVVVDLGRFDMGEGLRPSAEPALPVAAFTDDRIAQVSVGVGYEATFRRLRIKGGVQRTAHERVVAPPGELARSARNSPWLYDASAAYALNPRWTLFATATRGLEESGAAPGNAANANEVLQPAISTQGELGVRGQVGGLTLIASAFAIEKPAAGFDAANVYALVGELSHEGLEISLAGELAPGLRLVAGAAYLETRRSGPPVDAGVWSAEAVGVPKVQAMAGLTWSVPRVKGLSLDGQVSYSGDRRARSRGDLRTPDYAVADVGFLYAFDHGGRSMVLRGRVMNLFDQDTWIATRSELLERPSRRGGRLSLTVRY